MPVWRTGANAYAIRITNRGSSPIRAGGAANTANAVFGIVTPHFTKVSRRAKPKLIFKEEEAPPPGGEAQVAHAGAIGI